MPPLAVITMVFNERRKLPLWLAHYRKQVGIEHCYVVDHGTTDGSTGDLRGASRISLPRSAQDNDKRLSLITNLANGLLLYYKRVAYVDADELLVADPAKYENLSEYASRNQHDVVTSVGLEICHVTDNELPLSMEKSLGEQRSFALFSSSMCKANMIGRPVTWAAGWHSYDGPVRFDDLYLFHLRHADLDQAVERLSTTRSMPWSREDAGGHQRTSDQEMIDLVREFGSRAQVVPQDLLSVDSPLPGELAAFVRDTEEMPLGVPYHVPLARYGSSLVRLPPRFRAALGQGQPCSGTLHV